MFQVPACQGIGLEFMEKDCGPTSRKHNLETTIGGPPVPQFARWHVAKDIGAAFKKSAIGLRISAIAVKHHLIQILPGSWTWPPEILPSNQKSTVQELCWTSQGGYVFINRHKLYIILIVFRAQARKRSLAKGNLEIRSAWDVFQA